MSRKQRGMATQALVARFLQTRGWPWATDAGAGRSGADILNTPGLSIEVKARTAFSPLDWIRQARTNTKPGELPIVILRCNGQGEASIENWPAMLPLGELVKLLNAAGIQTLTPGQTLDDL